MPERYIVSKPDSNTEESQNILKQFHQDLFESLKSNETVLTSLATVLSIDGIIGKKLEDEIHRKKGRKEAATLLLDALENEVDQCPDILANVFDKMEHFEVLRGWVARMKQEASEDIEDSIRTG